jgi:polyhydroxyalkanoate synthesis repressor PhaR
MIAGQAAQAAEPPGPAAAARRLKLSATSGSPASAEIWSCQRSRYRRASSSRSALSDIAREYNGAAARKPDNLRGLPARFAAPQRGFNAVQKKFDSDRRLGARLTPPEASNRHRQGAFEVAEKQKSSQDEPITIKKYANRRLYNTATSSYVTLDHLCQMVKDGVDFVVYDAKTGDDITRPVLTQIIVEEESKGQNLLPINFLRQLISFYGDNLQFVVPRYLEHMMGTFATNQDRMRQHMNEAFGGMFPFNNFEEMGKQNLALFESAMKMFAPFGEEGKGAAKQQGGAKAAKDSNAAAGADTETLAQLKQQVDLLQRQLNALSQGSKKD